MPAPTAKRAVKTKRPSSTAIATADLSVSSVTGSEVSGKVEIQHQDIARLAYALWEARGFQEGTPEEDWLRAERQLGLGG